MLRLQTRRGIGEQSLQNAESVLRVAIRVDRHLEKDCKDERSIYEGLLFHGVVRCYAS